MIKRSLSVFITLAVNGSTASSLLFSEDVVEELRARMSDSCGTQCLDLFDDLLPFVSNITSTKDPKLIYDEFGGFRDYFGNITLKVRQQQAQLLMEIAHAHYNNSSSQQSPVDNHSTAVVGNIRKHSDEKPIESSFANVVPKRLPPPQPGLPCRTQAECDSKLFAINRCSYIREAAQNAYAGANTAVNVLANLMAVLCGCIFAGPVKTCVLIGIPYTCGFPFEAYQGLFSLSMSLWSAVTMTSSMCSSVGPDLTALMG